MNKKSDYELALNNISKITKFYLGQEVETPDGVGIIVEMELENNGLYISIESISIVVWYSTSGAKNGKVRWAYKLDEVKEVKSIERVKKIESILK